MRRTTRVGRALGAVVLVLSGCAGGDGDSSATPSVDSTDAPVTDSESTPTAAPELITVAQVPGDPPEDVPSALEDMDGPSYPAPLVDPAEIRSGGPPPDGIPPIDEPRFERASTVEWLADREPVIVVEIGGEARAYPVQILTWHEIVNDTFGTTPVAVTYCPLCNSAVVYDRASGDRILDFGTSGRLLNSSLVMYDRQTESLWSHFTAQAVIGTLTGTTLTTYPAATVSWAAFLRAHPDGLVLSRETGFERDYGQNPYPGYDDVESSPFLFDGEVDGRLPAQQRVVALRGGADSVAIPLPELTERGVVEVELDRQPVTVLHVAGTASALDSFAIAEGRDVGATGAFRPVVDGQVLTLRPDAAGSFVDDETGSTWDILGRATAGPLAGAQLERVEHLDTFWFAIAAFAPETRLER